MLTKRVVALEGSQLSKRPKTQLHTAPSTPAALPLPFREAPMNPPPPTFTPVFVSSQLVMLRVTTSLDLLVAPNVTFCPMLGKALTCHHAQCRHLRLRKAMLLKHHYLQCRHVCLWELTLM